MIGQCPSCDHVFEIHGTDDYPFDKCKKCDSEYRLVDLVDFFNKNKNKKNT